MQLSERELPGVAFVGNEALQHGEISLLASRGAVIDPSGQGRYMRKKRVGSQEAANLEVGIHACFNTAKEFDD